MKAVCECGKDLIDMFINLRNDLMVECPKHGLHKWGEVEDV